MIQRCSAVTIRSFSNRLPLGLLLALMACSSSEATRPPRGDGGATTLDGGILDESGEDAGTDAADAGEVVPPLPYDFSVKCAGDPCATAIAARGGGHACAALRDGSVRCWGSNASGQLGTGNVDGGWIPNSESTPRAVLDVSDAKAIAATGEGPWGTTCVVHGAGVVACFGSDEWGQLGVGGGGSRAANPVPIPLQGLQAKSVTLTSTFALAIDTNNRLWSWGANNTYQLARTASVGDAGSTGIAAEADRVSGAVRACAGTSTTGFVVVEDGSLFSWGGGVFDQLGRVTSLQADAIPSAVAISGVTGVATGARHACALGQGAVHCWGQNDHGQLGTGGKADEWLPARVVLPADVYPVAVAAGGNDSCIIAADGDVYCWGANGSGQLGVGTPSGRDQVMPVRVAELGEQAVAVAIMDASICALLRGGSVVCWGDNVLGQLGRGSRDTELHLEPGRVAFE